MMKTTSVTCMTILNIDARRRYRVSALAAGALYVTMALTMGLLIGLASLPVSAQTTAPPVTAPTPPQPPPVQNAPPLTTTPPYPGTLPAPDAQPTGTGAPLTLTLADALERAKKNSPFFQAAFTDLGVAHEDHVQARSALLPSVAFNTQYVYTQGNGSPTGRFLPNNGVHEYIAQGLVHTPILDPARFADYRRTAAIEAVAQARSVIAQRGLVVTVASAYYGLVAAQRKYVTAQGGVRDTESFLDLTNKLEQGGEVAHSDAIKADIQYEQRRKALRDSELDMERARLGLAVLLFPNFNLNFTVVDDSQAPDALPTYAEVQAMGTRNNPALAVAVSTLEAAKRDVFSAWTGYLPTVAVDYAYGIDANRFATRDSNGLPLLGYSTTATLLLPIWNWGATQSKVRQASLRREQARAELTYAQRLLLSDLQGFYHEADAVRAELVMLARASQLATENLRLSLLRYQAAEVSVTDVVDAQNLLVETRNAYDEALVRYRVAVANLNTLTGNF